AFPTTICMPRTRNSTSPISIAASSPSFAFSRFWETVSSSPETGCALLYTGEILWTSLPFLGYHHGNALSVVTLWELVVSCSFERHRFRIFVLRSLCLFVVLIYFPCLTMQAQSSVPDDADNGTAVLIDGSLSGSNSSAASLAASSPTSLSDSPLPGDKSLESSSHASLSSVSPVVPTQTLTPSGKFDLKSAFWQSFGVTFTFEAWRAAFDPGMRWNLAHKPFVHDWFASYAGYNMKRWGDGDDFLVNDVGHPLEGAVFARVFLQNSPNTQVVIGKNRRYWMNRLKALGWAAAWSTETEIGPL